MTYASGKIMPSWIATKLAAVRYKFLSYFNKKITLKYEGRDLIFRCDSSFEEMRAKSLFIKEPGTIRWIQKYVKPGQCFFDIGANIGQYSILAAHHVGEEGSVYAFEPHLINASQLLQNIVANKVNQIIRVLSCGLGSKTGFDDFNYFSLIHGSSFSQLGSLVDGNEKLFLPKATEMKPLYSVDALVDQGFPVPHHVKIDVDGNEFLILQGMERILRNSRLVTVQVEINQRHKDKIFGFFSDCGFKFVERHETFAGMRALESGVSAEEVTYNAVFARTPS